MPRARDSMWAHVIPMGKYGGSGTEKWKCKYCDKVSGGSANRIKAHFSGLKGKGIGACDKVPQDIKASLLQWRREQEAAMKGFGSSHDDMQEEEEDVTKRARVGDEQEMQSQTDQAAGSSSAPCAHRSSLPIRPSLKSASIKARFQKAAVAEATRELTRLFIQCALSFHIVRTPRWKKAMRAISRIGYEWEGPKYDSLRKKHLRDEKDLVELEMEPLKATWHKYGCTILCDGWTDMRKRNVYNILVSSCKGVMFMRAIDASVPGTVVTGAFIWQHIRQTVLEIGARHVVQVITDNGSNCVSMGRMLEDEFPEIVWTPCAAHSLDLMIEDVAKIPWISEIFAIARSMVRFVTKRPKVLYMYRAHSDLELLKPSKTRFAYMFIVIERLVRVQQGLLRTVVSREWMAWEDREQPKAVAFVRAVMRESWWDDAKALVKATQPLYSVLRITDMEGSTLGLLYEFMDRIGEALNRCTVLSAERYVICNMHVFLVFYLSGLFGFGCW